ncbi:MAG: polysaccharide deacetylase family protein [Sphingobacteriales bacterium]|nr:polysaccharide deacetylase family protein [Sphingobacteriales bacterium]MBI3720847.1 polysaccharide deacetylase family protein [Sphingobacteriales bacterium]
MKKILKNFFIKTIYYSGLPYFLREHVLHKKVMIVMLHNPGPDTAEKHFKWLAQHYNIITLDHYIDYRNGKASLPVKPLIITMDDGHIGNYDLLPIIKTMKIPVTIFLCSGIINTNRHYWFKYYELLTDSDVLKTVPNNKRLEYLAKSGFHPEKEFPAPQALTKEQIMEMKDYVNFQSHTVSHPCLNQCTDAESWKEVNESKLQLENEFNLHINAIAYPNGDYTERDIEYVKKAGYTCGLTVGFGYNGKNTSIYKLKRCSVNDNESLELLAIKATGIWSYLFLLFNKMPLLMFYNVTFSTRKLMRILILILPGVEDHAFS